jgi:type IV pilus assembly protein PilM
MFLASNTNYPIGLDISDLSLKMVQLKKSGDKIKIQALSKIDLPKGLIENGEIKNKTEIIKKIKEIIAKPKFGSFNSTDVVACLPDSKTFIKLIEVDKGLNSLEDIITAEIERHVPMSAKEIFFDWQIIRETADKYITLIGAAPQNIVNGYIDLFSDAKLSIAALEIESTAICRSLLMEEKPKNKNLPKKNYAIIDIGAQRSCMIIYAQNSIVSSISMPISGEKITEKISKTLEIKHEQAEKAKIICGLDKNKARGIIYEILSEMSNELNNRIKDALEFYSSHYPNLGPIDEIILCGGGANIKNIDQSIGQYQLIETHLGNTFINLSESAENLLKNFTETHNINFKLIDKEENENLAVRQNTGLTYTTAIGLALRNIL